MISLVKNLSGNNSIGGATVPDTPSPSSCGTQKVPWRVYKARNLICYPAICLGLNSDILSQVLSHFQYGVDGTLHKGIILNSVSKYHLWHIYVYLSMGAQTRKEKIWVDKT